jgi:DNA repair protein RadA/Sms
MARLKTIYRCQECGYSAAKPMGQCPDCSNWNTMVEEVVEARPAVLAGGVQAGPAAVRTLTDFSSKPVVLSEVQTENEKRTPTAIKELDRLLGGGVVPGQVILLAGAPGIGKSTLMLQTAAQLARAAKVLYVSGEESLKQVSGRAKRLEVSSEQLYLLSETSLVKVLGAFEQIKPSTLVLDSIQTVYHPELTSSPGSVAQVRECAAELLRLAKKTETTVFLLGHVTKDGGLAGPKVLEHIVDTVLYFDTERHDLLRVLRAHKNRFGPTDETGLFEMREKGLCEVKDAAQFFLAETETQRAPAGRAVGATLEGSRPMLVEAQALVVSTKYPLPRRTATGLDLNRVLVLIAAMEKHLRLRVEETDVFVSLAGGVRLKDPALDLAACMAVVSSAREQPIPADWVMIGEVGLLGEVSRVPHLENRLREAAKAGFKRALVPARAVKDLGKLPLQVVGVADLLEARSALFGASEGRGS